MSTPVGGGRGANAAANLVWQTHPSFKVFEKSRAGFFYTKEQADAFSAFSLEHKGVLSEACLFVSLAAFCEPSQMAILGKRKVGLVPDNQVLAVIRSLSNCLDLTVAVHQLKVVDDTIRTEHLTTIGKRGKVVNLLWFYNRPEGFKDWKRYGSHFLPIISIDTTPKLTSAVYPFPLDGDSEPVPNALDDPPRAEEVTQEPPAVEVVLAAPPVEVQQAPEGPKAIEPPAVIALPAEESQIDPTWQLVEVEEVIQVHSLDTREDYLDIEGEEAPCEKLPGLHSEFPPLFAGLRWVSGWWAMALKEHPIDSLGFLEKPKFVMATAESFQRFGPCMSYLHHSLFHIPNEVQRIDGDICVHGPHRCRLLNKGDVVVADKISYRCVEVTAIGSMKFEALSRGLVRDLMVRATAPLIRWFPFADSVGKVSSKPHSLERELQERINWTVLQEQQKDTVIIAAAQQARNYQASRGYPDSAMDVMRGIFNTNNGLKDFTGLTGVGFSWGDCFSCGKKFPSERLAGRICKDCSKKNTADGQLVADGKRVTSAKAPVCYPGVVNTSSRHPAIKRSVETRATVLVFRESH